LVLYIDVAFTSYEVEPRIEAKIEINLTFWLVYLTVQELVICRPSYWCQNFVLLVLNSFLCILLYVVAACTERRVNEIVLEQLTTISLNFLKWIMKIFVHSGVGNGLTLISSSVVLQQYFDRRRTLATALATTGFGLSPLVVAPVTRWMAATLGWRMAMLLLGCAYMHGAISGALMRPPPIVRETTKVPPVDKNVPELQEATTVNG
jgi:MFS family permease